MIDKLFELLCSLKDINTEYNLISNNDFEEQHENLVDLKELIDDLDKVITSIKEKSLKSEKETELLEVHRILTTLEWHFSEISELNKKILKRI